MMPLIYYRKGYYNNILPGQDNLKISLYKLRLSCIRAGQDSKAAHGLTEQNGDMTYYDLGLTACGQTYTNADMVAALAFDWFTTPNPNEDPMCGRMVRITDPATSNTVEVEVRDKCQACQHDDIDVSPTAFQTLQPLEVGRYKVTWDFI